MQDLEQVILRRIDRVQTNKLNARKRTDIRDSYGEKIYNARIEELKGVLSWIRNHPTPNAEKTQEKQEK